jgi:DNA-binding transcriptional regulator LsrR (DeoR family)
VWLSQWRSRRGLGEVYDFAQAVVSVGSLGSEAAIARFALIGEADRKALREYGGVGEMLCNVFDRDGRMLDHPLDQRVMSVPIGSVRATPIRVGAHKPAAIAGAIKLLAPTALVTDAATARRLTADW